MNRYLFAFLSIFIVAPLVQAEEIERSISVTGQGLVSAAPDMAEIRLGVETSARLAHEALATNSNAMREVLNELQNANVDARDIQTTQLSLFPTYDQRMQGERPRVNGYTARNIVVARVRDLPSLGGILDRATQFGGNSIQSISFGIADTSELMNDARKKAVADARAKAELYATAAGARVGNVISISESSGARAYPVPMARAEMASDVPIAEGEMNLSTNVHIVFELE